MTMPTDANIELARQWVEQTWNAAQLDLLEQFHPEIFLNEGQIATPEDMRAWHLRNRATFPDIYYVIQDIFATDDRVAFRWTATATQRGALWNLIPATNKRVGWSGIHLLKIEHQKIVEVWALSDFVSMLQQLEVQLQLPES